MNVADSGPCILFKSPCPLDTHSSLPSMRDSPQAKTFQSLAQGESDPKVLPLLRNPTHFETHSTIHFTIDTYSIS